jgi:hypothetical protein
MFNAPLAMITACVPQDTLHASSDQSPMAKPTFLVRSVNRLRVAEYVTESHPPRRTE